MISTTNTTTVTFPAAGTDIAVPFPLRFDEEEHLLVYRVSSTGGRDLLVEGVNYSVSGTGNEGGGTVTVFTVTAGDSIIIAREVDITQQQDYVTNDRFPAEGLESQLDKQIQIDQQLNDGVERAITVLPGETNPVVSSQADRSETIMVWDSDGNYTEDTPAELLSRLPIPSGTISGNGMKVIPDKAARTSGPTYAPDFVGQLGVQVDNGAYYTATGVTTGDWESIDGVEIVTTSAELALAIADDSIIRIGIKGWIPITQDFIDDDQIGPDKKVFILRDSGFTLSASFQLEINATLIAPPHVKIFDGVIFTDRSFPRVFGTFGGVDRYFGWWTETYPEVTDHSEAFNAAMATMRFRDIMDSDGTRPIQQDWRPNDSPFTSTMNTSVLHLFFGGIVLKEAINVTNVAMRIVGAGNGSTIIRFDDAGTALPVTVDFTASATRPFTLDSGSLADGDRVIIDWTTEPGGMSDPEANTSKQKTFEVYDYSGGSFALIDVGATDDVAAGIRDKITLTSNGADVTVAKCENTGFTQGFYTTGHLQGFQMNHLCVSVSRTVSPGFAILDLTDGGFIEHTKLEDCQFTLEYGGNVLRSTAGNGLNHITFRRNTCYFDGLISHVILSGDAGTLPTSAVSDTFADGDVTVGTDNINITSHPFTQDDRVQLTNSGGDLPTGLGSSIDYFVQYVDADNFTLSRSYGGADVNITVAAGGGTHTITKSLVVAAHTTSITAGSNPIDTTTYVITSADHGLNDNDKVRVTTSDTLPTGLAVDTDYYVEKIDIDTFTLAATLDGPTMTITDQGVGTHTLSNNCCLDFNDVMQGVDIDHYESAGQQAVLQFHDGTNWSTGAYRFQISNMNSAGSILQLRKLPSSAAKGEQAWIAPTDTTMLDSAWRIYIRYNAALPNMDEFKRSFIYLAGFDAKVEVSNNSLIRGYSPIYLDGAVRANALHTSDNHTETASSFIRNESSSGCMIISSGDKYFYGSGEDRKMIVNNSIAGTVLEASGTVYRNANNFPMAHVYDIRHNGRTGDSTDILLPQGMVAPPTTGFGQFHSSIIAGNASYSLQHGGAIATSINYATASAEEVAVTLGLGTFFRADTGVTSSTETDTFTDGDVTTGTDVIAITGHPFVQNDRVILTTDGTLPTGLSTSVTYYVQYIDANSFTLSLTAGGAAVDITAASGGGTHTITTPSHLTAWAPAVGSREDFIHTTAGPAYDATGIDGKPALLFDADTATHLTSNIAAAIHEPLPGADGGFLIVYQYPVVPSVSTYLVDMATPNFQFLYFSSLSGTRMIHDGSTELRLAGDNASPAIPLASVAGWGSGTGKAIMFSRAQVSSDSAYATAPATGVIYLGAADTLSATSHLNGHISDVGWWHSKPSPQQLRAACEYVRTRYACKVKLPK